MDNSASPTMVIGIVAGIFLVGIILYYLINIFLYKDERMDMIIRGIIDGNVDGANYNRSAAQMKEMAGATEYSFTFWAYVDSFDGKRHIIMDRDSNGLYNPRVYLSDEANKMVFVMSNTAGEKLECDIPMLPLQRWNCFTVNVFSNSINVYMNGRLFRSCTFFKPDGSATSGLPFPNVNAGLSVKPGTDFPGKLATMFFRNTTMSAEEVMSTYQAGPTATSGLLHRLFGIKEIRVVFGEVL